MIPQCAGERGPISTEQQIEDVLADAPGTFGIYARHLGTNEVVDIKASQVLPAESAAKVFVLLRYRRLVDAGTCNPLQRVTLKQDDRLWGTGVLRYLAPGLEPTLEDLAWLMIIVSDNVATALLMQEIGTPDDVNGTMKELGLETAQMNTSFIDRERAIESAMAGEPFATSSPRDLAEAFTFLDEPAKAILFRQQNLISLPRRLPHAADASDVGIEMPVRAYNKTGNGPGTCVDAGLFETTTASWIVGAMASDQTDFASRADDAAPTAFARIGELLYNDWGT